MSAESSPLRSPPLLRAAVLIERQQQPSEWEAWRFTIADVVLDEGHFGDRPRLLRDDGRSTLSLHPGLPVTLHADEGEGYYLNLSSGAPAWFVVWRADDEDPGRAWPEIVSVSYNEAGRWLDAQEHVEQLPMPDEVAAWLQAYTDENYRPEPKKRRRPQSFLPPEDRRS